MAFLDLLIEEKMIEDKYKQIESKYRVENYYENPNRKKLQKYKEELENLTKELDNIRYDIGSYLYSRTNEFYDPKGSSNNRKSISIDTCKIISEYVAKKEVKNHYKHRHS